MSACARTVADYALIGDLQSAALVGRSGSIDWFCAPRFDSDASFAALVGDDDNGSWCVAPIDENARVTRRYRGATLVLETTFDAVDGRIRLVDFMPTGTQQRTIVRVGGERLTGEEEASWLAGFAHSKPVRIANDAHMQFQPGVYGDLVMCFEHAQRVGVPFEAEHWQIIESVMHYIEKVWQRPGNGIWETRKGGRQYVDSKVMAWVGIDRGIALAQRGGFVTDVAHWQALAARMHAEIVRAGYDEHRGTFTQYYGSQELDASLLLMPVVGFLPPDDPRVARTVAAIERELVVDGFVYRYSADGVHEPGGALPSEGAFTICGFWLAQAYALMGRHDDARAVFERLVGTANDVGLLSEEFGVARGIAIGNVPQGFPHAGLIDAAHLLSQRRPASVGVAR